MLNQSPPAQILLLLFLLASVCGTGFWVLTAHSLIRGVLLSLACQALIFLALGYVCAPLLTNPLNLFDTPVVQIALAALIYCGGLVWLGRGFWSQRRWTLAGAVAVVVVFWGLSFHFAGGIPAERAWNGQALFQGLFLCCVLCSTSFWTLFARSTVGGMALSMAMPFALALAGSLLVSKTSFASGPGLTLALLAGTMAYSGLFLWLGWWKFTRLEAWEVQFATPGRFATGAGSRWWSAWLVCRPRGLLANLVRKELRLQRPVLLIAAAFTLGWLALLAAQWVRPAPELVGLLDVLVCFYIPVTCLLTGCMSLGEEKAMGVAGWHLTLPVGVRWQWLVKLAASLVVAGLLGLVLPLLLAWGSSHFLDLPEARSMRLNDGFWQAFGSVGGTLFLMGFWAATLESSTVRAALVGVLALLLLVGCAVLGGYWAHLGGGLQSGRILYSVQILQGMLTPDTRSVVPLVLGLGSALITVFALGQSLVQFRQVQPQTDRLAKQFVLLAAWVTLVSFWCVDLVICARE